MSKKKKPTYYADFETTQPTKDDMSVEVYLWCMLNSEDEFVGRDIQSFMRLCEVLDGVIYFHNLKFDFSYIQYYLIENNIKYELLEKKGTIYSVKFYGVELRDSMNFLPMTLKEVGENYCDVYKKSSIEHIALKGHIATDEEIDYCINDCRVLQEGLENYLNTLVDVLYNAGSFEASKKVFKKLTNSGIAFESFKELSDFEKLCPKTTANEYENFSKAYKGGYVYSKPTGIEKDVQMIDCNSMYPYIYSTIEMPFGNGVRCSNLEDCKKFGFYIIKILCKYELKPGYISIIGGGVGKYGGTLYKSSSNGEYEELTICNIDFDLINKFYDIEFDFIWGYGFNTKKNFFKDYCDIFLKVKNENKGIKRNVAKVMLNSPYGKTAMNGLSEIKRYFIEDNQVKSEVVGYQLQDEIFQYLPIAIQITAGARRLLLTTANEIGFDNVFYMDTDSIKFRNVPHNIKFDPNILGAWKDEGRCALFKTISPKKYVYYYYDEDKKKYLIKYTCAGFSKQVLTEEMQHGLEVDYSTAYTLMTKFDKGLELSCLQSVKVKGGRALLPVKKEIK